MYEIDQAVQDAEFEFEFDGVDEHFDRFLIELQVLELEDDDHDLVVVISTGQRVL